MLRVALLGPILVEADAKAVLLSSGMQRAVLAALSLARGHVLSVEGLIDALWHVPPPTAANALQHHVGWVRKRLGADRLVTVRRGYQLVIEDDDVDASRFSALLRHAKLEAKVGELSAASEHAQSALALWRGPALTELPDCPFVDPARRSLDEALTEATLLHVQLGNRLGNQDEILESARAAVYEHPLDERFAAELIRALAQAGRQADALAEFGAARARLREELGSDPGTALRDAHAYALSGPASSSDRGPAPAWQHERPPRPVTELIGRTAELVAVESLLSSDARLVTLTGPGGVGKTRLAQEVATRQARHRPVAFATLEAIDREDLVIPRIASALGIHPTANDGLISQIATMIMRQDLLLVLDNLEHLIGSAEHLSQLLAGAERLQILATSREALRTRPEHVLVVAPLATAGTGDSTPPAVELFTVRAKAVNPAFNSASDPQGLVDLCTKLEGLPLAIELAAARSNVLSVAAMTERLENRLGLLGAGRRDAPDRQKSLRSCIAWGVALLAPTEQRLFAALSVFAGGASLAAIETVVHAIAPDADVLELTDSLTTKSLLHIHPTELGHRFSMLESVREYAEEVLRDSGDEPAARQAHAHYFEERFTKESPWVPWPPRTAREAAEWDLELPNARAALAFLEATGQELALTRLTLALCPLWRARGPMGEMNSHLERLGDLALESNELHAAALYWRGIAALQQADLAAGGLLLERARQSVKDLADNTIQAALCAILAAHSGMSGDCDTAQAWLAHACSASQRSGDPELVAWVDSLRVAAGLPGDGDAMEAALMVAHEARNEILESIILVNLSEMALSSPDPDRLRKAYRWARRAVELSLSLGDLDDAASGAGNAAAAQLLLGMPLDQALHDSQQSLQWGLRTSDTFIQIENLLRIAAIDSVSGRRARAVFLTRAWLQLDATHSIGLSPSNQRLWDAYLDGTLEPLGSSLRSADLLALAVSVALGEAEDFPQ